MLCNSELTWIICRSAAVQAPQPQGVCGWGLHPQHTHVCVFVRLQAWFVARRRKDKKKQDTPGASEAGAGDADGADDAAQGGGGSGPAAVDAAQAELLELAKAALPVPFREDGPPLVSEHRAAAASLRA